MKLKVNNKSSQNIAGVAAFILAAIFLTIFRHWEPSGETWGYWLFARIFSEMGKFVIIGRSPIYILYLNLFSWLGFPLAVTAEYIVTSLILGSCLVVFFRRYIGLFWAVLAVVLWIPFFQSAEPPVQKLALACACLAIVVRDPKLNRSRLAISYALFVIAYMLRSSYIIFIIFFLVYDTLSHIMLSGFKSFFRKVYPKFSDWPIAFVLILLLWFILAQSPSRWNNAWFTSTTWFPCKGKNLAEAGFIQSSNSHYIAYKYGSFMNKDFYFTNQELFGGADNLLSAIKANPKFLIIKFIRQTKDTFCEVASLTMLPRIFYRKIYGLSYLYYSILLFFTIPFLLFIFYGALRLCRSKAMFLFIITSVVSIAGNAIVIAKTRYMFTLAPIFILGAFFYGRKFIGLLEKKGLQLILGPKLFKLFCSFIMLFFLTFLSPGFADWQIILKDFVADARKNEIRILQARPYSLKANFYEFKTLVNKCRGVISLEHWFIGAFTGISLDRVYDIWEIPPFGYFAESDYNGLNPERIDCILISDDLSENIGYGTNYQLRYQNYIEPYARYLEDRGAKSYDIEEFGKAVILYEKLGG